MTPPYPGPRPPFPAPITGCQAAAYFGVRSTRPRQFQAPSDTTSDIRKVMSLPPVTRVTQLSSHSLRARTRRPNPKSCVTNVISLLTSDTVTRNYNYQLHRARTPMWQPNKTCVTHVTGGQA